MSFAKSKITLAGGEFTITELKLGQMRRVAPLLATLEPPPPGQSDQVDRIGPMTAVVAEGLRAAHPEMTVEALEDLPIRLPDLVEAVQAVLVLSGLIAKGATDPNA